MSNDRWMDKEYVVYTVEYYSAIKRNEIMDIEIIILSKVSSKEKNNYYMISLICGI